jgi:septal ring factor EnvC (AmiA/AmiB activator)
MSIYATSSNYISNASIQEWMEKRTDALYGKMRDAMDTSTERAKAEDQLNDLKSQILELKTNGKDTSELRTEMHAVLDKYGAEFPEVGKALTDLTTTLEGKYAEALQAAKVSIFGMQVGVPAPVKLGPDEIDNWSQKIGKVVDGLSKQDELGMLDIQEINAQVNQAKQTASALMDASDKSANVIINHIG